MAKVAFEEASHWEVDVEDLQAAVDAAKLIEDTAQGVGQLVSCVLNIGSDPYAEKPTEVAYLSYLNGRWVLSDRPPA